MRGKIRTRERCECGQAFRIVVSPATGDQTDLVCDCGRRPRFFYVDARGKGFATKITTDLQGRKFDSFLGAHRFLTQMRADLDNHRFDAARYVPEKRREMLLSDRADAFLARCRRDCSAAYAASVKAINEKWLKPMMGDLDVRDVRRKHIEDLRAAFEEGGLSPMSVKSYLLRVSAFFAWLVRREEIEKRPGMPDVRVPHVERGWTNRAGQEKIIEKIAPRHRLLFEVLCETGMRPSEAAGLKVRDLIDGELLIERSVDRTGKDCRTKTGKIRYVAVSVALFAKLEAHAGDRFGEDYLFKTRYGTPYRSAGMSVTWRKAAEAAGIAVSLYCGTRHSRASMQREHLEQQMRADIAASLGHADSRTTLKHYAQPRRANLYQLVPETRGIVPETKTKS